MKYVIFCIIGESGSGKTLLADALEKYAGIQMIQSYTDRPKRTPDENGHTFLTKQEFDALKQEEMIAWTKFGNYRYCCLKKDIRGVNTYVIDEHGLEMLHAKYYDTYKIYDIRLKRPRDYRIESVGQERVDRDEGKFYLPDDYFDCVINNDDNMALDVISKAWLFIRKLIVRDEDLSVVEAEFCRGTKCD